MSVKFFCAAGTNLLLADTNSRIITSDDGYLTFLDCNTPQDVVEVLSVNHGNIALNIANFPAQVDVNGTSFECTYGGGAAIVIGDEVDETPVIAEAPEFTTTDITAVFNVALDDSITNVAGLIVTADGVTQTVDSISITTDTLTITCHTSMATKDVVLEYVPSAGGTLISDDGALVGYIAPIVVTEA